MNDYDYSGVKKTKNHRHVLVIILSVLCVATLMIGSGVFGAVLTAQQMRGTVAELRQWQADANLVIEEFTRNTDATILELEQRQADSYAFISGFTQESAQTGEVNQGRGIMTLPELFQETNPAIVAISTQVQGVNIFGRVVTHPSAGSGFLVSEDGYIVTNHHVIENAISISVLLYDGTSHPAELIGGDAHSDLAVLKINAQGLSFLNFADSDALLVGEPVAALGNPLGEFANSMSVGVVSALDRSINIDGTPRIMLQTDAAVNSGNSGGPLVDMSGYVVGVVTAKFGGANVEGLGFAIPANVAQRVAEDIINDGFVRGRPVMGVQVGEVILDGERRIFIDNVISGGGAARAGVLPGDIILSANGQPISTFETFRAILDTFAPGDTMTLQVMRNAEIIEFAIILDEFLPPA